MNEVRTLYVDNGEDGVRLDRWFKRRWPHLNHIQLNKLFRSGQVRVDGSRVKADTKLAAGSQVRVPPLPDAPDKDEKRALSPRERMIVRERQLVEAPRTLESLGLELKLSKERIRQLEAAAFAKLRRALEAQGASPREFLR